MSENHRGIVLDHTVDTTQKKQTMQNTAKQNYSGLDESLG